MTPDDLPVMTCPFSNHGERTLTSERPSPESGKGL